MKKNKFLALTMLCSAFCGVPTKAQEIKASVPKKFIKNEKKLKVKGANSYSSGEFFESKDLKKRSNNGFSDFVNLVIDHPIWSFMIGGGPVAVEEGIRRKLHSKQEVEDRRKLHSRQETHEYDEYAEYVYRFECFLNDELVKGEILGKFFDFVFTFDYEGALVLARQKLKARKEYYLKRKLNYEVLNLFKTLDISKKYGKLKSSIGTLGKTGVKSEIVTYVEEDSIGALRVYVDLIVGEQKVCTDIIHTFFPKISTILLRAKELERNDY